MVAMRLKGIDEVETKVLRGKNREYFLRKGKKRQIVSF